MENFLLAFEVVFPLFLLMALGYGVRKTLGLDGGWVETTNKLLFRVLLPLMLFRNMYESDLTSALQMQSIGVLLYGVLGMGLMFLILFFTVPRFEPSNPRRAALIQGTYRSNTAIFGLPVAIALYGQDVAIVVLMLAFIVPMLNILSVICLEYFRGGKPRPREIIKNVVTNPLIIGIVLGIVCNVLHVPLPGVVKEAAWGLASCTTTASFFVLGASFSFASAAHNRKALTFAVLGKLVFMPLVFIGIGILLGFRNQALLAVFTVFAPPTAVSSFPMASAMGADAQLASEIVAFTSVLCLLSIFLWVFALKALALV